MPLAARTSLLSVGSPLMRKREPRGSRAAASAPALLRSSPTTKSKPKLRTPAASNFSAAAIMLAMMPLASAEPTPDEIWIFAGCEEGRPGIHVRRQGDERDAPVREDVE